VRRREIVAVACGAVLVFVACGPPPPSRVEGTLVSSIGGVNGSVQASFASLARGGVTYAAQPAGKLASVLLPVSGKSGAAGTPADVVGLSLDFLPPMLLWRGPATFSTVTAATLDEQVFESDPEDAEVAVLSFEGFEVTEDPHMPFVARGTIAGRITADTGSITFVDTVFTIAADCGPEGTADVHLCGEPALYAQFYGLGNDQTDCPIELVRHFTGTSVNVLVVDRVLTIGDVGAPFTCIPTEKEPANPEHPRLICHAAVESFEAGGCSWNATAITTPQARYFTLSASSTGTCGKATCNAIKF